VTGGAIAPVTPTAGEAAVNNTDRPRTARSLLTVMDTIDAGLRHHAAPLLELRDGAPVDAGKQGRRLPDPILQVAFLFVVAHAHQRRPFGQSIVATLHDSNDRRATPRRRDSGPPSNARVDEREALRCAACFRFRVESAGVDACSALSGDNPVRSSRSPVAGIYATPSPFGASAAERCRRFGNCVRAGTSTQRSSEGIEPSKRGAAAPCRF
jgi:hypothetical protein